MSRDGQSLGDVLGAIQRDFSCLSPQLQLGARFLIDHPQDVAVSSMRVIAGRAGVQPATLVRLAHSLGFPGWQALRAKFIDSVRATPHPFSHRAADLARREDSRTLFQETFGALSASIEATRRGISDDAVCSVAQSLESAETVYIAGFRSCFAPAFTFYYAYRLFRPSGLVLLSGTGGVLEAELRALGKKDAVLLISFDPYSREAGVVAELARSVGARFVAVTDSIVAPPARGADHNLIFSTGSTSFFPSIVAASALLESVIAVLLARAGGSAVDGVRAAEAQLFALGAYLRPPRFRTGGRRPS
jgi:DNA-binding MurR/RpiR family transcriptional regulator